MKTKFFIVAVMVAALLFVGCTMTRIAPIDGGNGHVTENTEILGRITITVPSSKAGYTLLWEEAKKQYPEADDIVNILVDGKSQLNLFQKTPSMTEYIMSALVVKYN